MPSLANTGVFITGTDTEVGKTVVTALLAAGLTELGINTGVFKPVASGAVDTPEGPISADARFLHYFSGVTETLGEINPVLLRAPIAPSAAAKIEGVTVDLAAIRSAFRSLSGRHDLMLVEGAGGIMTPLTETYLMRDLARSLDLPCIVVARAALGTVNHTALTVEALRGLHIPIIGVIVTRFPERPGLAERTAIPLIEEIIGVQVLGKVPHDDRVDIDNLSLGDLLKNGVHVILARKLIETIAWN